MNSVNLGFGGQRFDPEVGLYYFNARYYSPALGRFLQNDPLGYGGGSFNLYGYVNNDPLNLFDPLGLDYTGGADNFSAGVGVNDPFGAHQAFGTLLGELDTNAGYILDGMKPGSSQYVPLSDC